MDTHVTMWLVGIVGTLFCGLVIYVLNSINESIKGVKEEVSHLNNNLVRIDRRVAYLEGRLSGHPEEQPQRRGGGL